MNKKLFEQATRNVKGEIEEDFKERVKEEYKLLLHDSQKKKANKATLKRLKQLFEKSKKVNPRNWGDSFNVFHAKETIKEYVKTGIYHPQDLNELEKWVDLRLN